ncbi:MAG TPA: type II toxin-antitoxin system VapC family toxin [Terriglobia bacterium]|nr:type II toxin-antitoxin system VapC family toxin [Terriglobia bacterium]
MILLDTHVVVWLAADARKLSRLARRAIERARQDGGLAISCLTFFELTHLVVGQRIVIAGSLDLFLEQIESRFVVIPLDSRIAARSVQLPASYPNDPMDRMIGATALARDLALVTAADRIRGCGAVKTIW